MPDFQPFSGYCQCGTVRYRVTAPANEMYHCHCAMCRRCHGAQFATYATVAREHLIVEQGADNLATFDSSSGVHRLHCRTCGCQLFLDVDAVPQTRWYTPGTADGHPGHPPESEKHVFVGSKWPWHEITDDLPQYEAFAPHG